MKSINQQYFFQFKKDFLLKIIFSKLRKMGQYFWFYNLTRLVPNKKGIPSNGGLMWISHLNRMEDEWIIDVFNEIIRINGWDPNDTIIARGDYKDNFVLHLGQILDEDIDLSGFEDAIDELDEIIQN